MSENAQSQRAGFLVVSGSLPAGFRRVIPGNKKGLPHQLILINLVRQPFLL